MSGIVALFNLAQEPICRPDLERLTEFLSFRGPDAQAVWHTESHGFVGLGHTQLVTTWEAAYEQQPFSLDQQVWIVADARIDDRATLAAKLALPPLPSFPLAPGTPDTAITTDVELIFRAYLKWGEACVEHLLGDFAFVIWDGHNQKLFAARDHYGIKLFYYSLIGNLLLMSNTLNCLRQHASVSNTLHQQVMGEFLLFDFNYDLSTTIFADIQRLPPAHTLTCANGQFCLRRYWTLPQPELLRYRRNQDYIDQFAQVMGQAVAERTRTDKVAAYLSGGLDSTTIAATALRVAKQQNRALDYQGYTIVYDHLIPDQERYYTSLAAEHLQIPVQFHVADDHTLFQNWQGPALHYPEPYDSMLSVIQLETFQVASQHSRVLLTGDGGDEALVGATVRQCFAQMPLTDLAGDVWQSLRDYHLQPDWGFGLGSALRKLRGQLARQPAYAAYEYPSWINPEFATRLNLAERWQNWHSELANRQYPTPRSRAYLNVTTPRYLQGFEAYDPGSTGIALEIYHPFLDLRVLQFLLALPPIPWCIRKQLQRVAMGSALPTPILKRPKSPQAGSPVAPKVKAMTPPPITIFGSGAQTFLDVNALLTQTDATGQPLWQTYTGLRAIGVSYWLQQLD